MVLLGTIAVAPWLIGSVPANFQLWIAAAVLVAFGLWALSLLATVQTPLFGRPVLFPSVGWPLLLFCAIGVLQLTVPSQPPSAPSSPWQSTLFPTKSVEDPTESSAMVSVHRASIAPAVTRFQLAKLVLVLLAAFLGAQLFRTQKELLWLFGILALTGVALSVFGTVQKLNWNGQLFGFVPLRQGGSPFASFVNRNNAAGFLNICLAAALGGYALAAQDREDSDSQSASQTFLLLATLILSGIMICMSRGGIAAALIGLGVLAPWVLRNLGRQMLLIAGGVALAVGGIMSWLNFSSAIHDRMVTLRDMTSAIHGRLQHWTDTLGAIRDRPILGSGWGTYPYANLPYQQHYNSAHFIHADNEYFEIAVEGGLLAVVSVVLFFALTTLDLRRLLQRKDSRTAFGIGLAGMFVLVSVGLQQASDFGISFLALALPSAVILGSVSAVVKTESSDSGQLWDSHDPSSATQRLAVPLMILLGFAAGWAGFEMSTATAAKSFQEQLPLELDDPKALTEGELQSALARGNLLIQQRPDDPELHKSLARLEIYRYCLSTFQQIREQFPQLSLQLAWRQSQLDRLHDFLHLTVDEEARLNILNSEVVQKNLTPAALHLEVSRSICPWIPGVHSRLYLIPTAEGRDDNAVRIELLRQEALLKAGYTTSLIELGSLAWHRHADALALQCWQRALRLEPEQLPRLVTAARTGLDDDQIAGTVLESPEQLIAFSRLTRSFTARGVIARRLNSRLASSAEGEGENPLSPAERAWIGAHVAQLEGDEQTAVRRFEEAVKLDPLSASIRVDLAELLIRNGKVSEARIHLAVASRLAPRNEALRNRLQAVIEMDLRSGPENNPPAEASPVER